MRRSDDFFLATTPASVVFLPTRMVPTRRTRKMSRDRNRQPRLGITPPSPPAGFLSIRDLFETDIMSSSSSNVDTTYTRIERNTVRSDERERRDRRDRVVKDEVYTITGLGGSILILSLLVSLAMVRRYKRKLMENSDSTTFRRNSVDFGPSFQHSSGDNNSLNKIYSLIKSKEEKAGKDKEKDKDWLNPLAKPGSEAGSGVSRVTRTTLDEDRARSAGEEMDVDQNPAVVETQPVPGTEAHQATTALSLAENNGEKHNNSASWGVADTERGKLLLEIYNGGTFKKSMNYHSFREHEKRSSREVSIDNLETDSLEISGSQLTVLPPSEISRRGRSRLSDIFPDILNFKSLSSGTERPIPSPDYPSSSPEKSLSTISEQEAEKTMDEKPVTHTQYYFGDHVMEKKPQQDTETTRVKFNLDLRTAIIHLPRAENREEPEVKDGLSSLDILPENTKPSLNRARLRQLYESQSAEDYDTPRRGPPVPVKTKQKKNVLEIVFIRSVGACASHVYNNLRTSCNEYVYHFVNNKLRA